MYYVTPTPTSAREDYARSLAIARIGNLGTNGHVHWNDCEKRGDYEFLIAGTGAATVNITSGGGGFWDFNCGTAYAAAQCISLARTITLSSTKRWHIGVRASVGAFVKSANTEMRFGTLGAYVGHMGSTSTTNYAAAVAGVTMVSSRALTTSMFIGEVWGIPSVGVYMSIDFEAAVSGAATAPTTGYPFHQSNSNAGAGAPSPGTLDWAHYYSEADL